MKALVPWVFLVALFFAYPFVQLYSNYNMRELKNAQYGTKEGAEEHAISFLKSVLKSPSTMKLIELESTRLSFEEPQQRSSYYDWEVTGAFESQNGYGALLRADFIVGLAYWPHFESGRIETGNYKIAFHEIETR